MEITEWRVKGENGTKIEAEISTNLKCTDNAISIQAEFGHPALAELAANHLNKDMSDTITSMIRRAYLDGCKDGRLHKVRKTVFANTLTNGPVVFDSDHAF